MLSSSVLAATLLVTAVPPPAETTGVVSVPAASASQRLRAIEPIAYLGCSGLLRASYLFTDAGLSLDALVEGRLARGFLVGLGGRLSVGPLAPEGFARASVAPALGRWMGSAGVELGITARRSYAPAKGNVARTLHDQAEEAASPIYVALHAAPLRFRVWQRWQVNVLDVAVGSHVAPLGEHLRVQVGFLSVGRAL